MPSLPEISLAKINAVLPSAFTIAFLAGIMHAVFLLLFILFATDLMAFVPMAALAAILFMVAWGMSEYQRFLALLRMPNGDPSILLTFLPLV